ncbi:YcxB family protein [Aquimarina sp. D1M17]|uniref:YcxB family protein n=1 Tax=Aquimarina acroporae TaxID=2937283 RepID=UPI0020C0ED92|nr:YcxB family protein [Aquimarina acroporae]MCK8521059.1 YcxB family protein [Aquimarina acroporae]
MKFEYILEEKDFVDFHLFSIDENKNSKKIKNIGKLVVTGILVYFSINMYTSNNLEFAIILGVLAILALLFFDRLYQSKLKKHFSKIARQSYAGRIGEKETMEFTSEHLITQDKTGEGKTKLSEIDKVNETKNNFFIKLTNGASFIVSKNGLDNPNLIKSKLNELNIPIDENLDWEWK